MILFILGRFLNTCECIYKRASRFGSTLCFSANYLVLTNLKYSHWELSPLIVESVDEFRTLLDNVVERLIDRASFAKMNQ